MSEPKRRAPPMTTTMVPGELNQAYVRLAIVGALTLYTGITSLTEPEQHSPVWFVAPVLYLLWSLLLLGWAYRYCRPGSPRWSRMAQRIVCMVSDYGALSFGVSVGGAAGAPLYPIYLWITFGNGIRYGVRYLALSTLIALLTFGAMLLATPYWHENRATGLGLLLGLAVLPAYVAQLLKRLTTTLAAAQEASEVKTRFIANMSHELRTPLHGVIAVADLMAHHRLDSGLKDMLAMIQSSARTQLALVNRILDVSRLSAGQITLAREPFRLVDVVRESEDIIRPQARAKGLVMHILLDPALALRFLGSAEHLRQVLINLLGNAVKFTDRGFVALRVKRVGGEQALQRLSISVADSGIGISPEAQDRIFRPFTQADSSVTRRFGGSGLGVSIAQELVHLMGAEIRVNSTPGQGACFSFELTLPVAPEAPALAGPPGGSAAEPIRVWTLGFPPDGGRLSELLQSRAVAATALPALDTALDSLGLGLQTAPAALLVNAAGGLGDLAGVARKVHGDPRLERLPLVAVDCGPERTDLIEAGYTCLLENLRDPALLWRALAIATGLTAERESAGQADETPMPADRPLTVLVADDHPTNRAVLRLVLEKAGHRVHLAEDGGSALAALDQGTHDLALVDMHMPGLSGADVVREHRLHRGEAATPVVLLTADTTDAAREDALQAGVLSVLIKPIRPAALLDAVQGYARGGPAAASGAVPVAPAMGGHGAPPQQVAGPPLLEREVLDELSSLSPEPGIMKQLADGFLQDGQSAFERMDAALAEARYAEFFDLAHGLKGSARNIGARALAERLDAIDRLELWQLGEAGRQLLGLSRERFAETAEALREYLDAKEESSSERTH